jgi:uncharacterized protein
MRDIIINKLEEIEQQNNIKLLFACESGSRGWGFPSPDSDYDVRFMYVRPVRFYLSVVDRRYDIHFPITDELDVYGWDIRKVLQLVRKSNTTPFEWLQSPVIYKEQEGFKESLFALCQHYFSRRANIHHYLGIAKSSLESIAEDGEMRIKKLFYVLRPLLAAKWCLEKNSIAPMTIEPLMTLLPPALQKQVQELITLKAGASESFPVNIDNELRTYVENEFAATSEASTSIPRDQFDADMLDDFFVKTITAYDH